jgi:hypothetical protein
MAIIGWFDMDKFITELLNTLIFKDTDTWYDSCILLSIQSCLMSELLNLYSRNIGGNYEFKEIDKNQQTETYPESFKKNKEGQRTLISRHSATD